MEFYPNLRKALNVSRNYMPGDFQTILQKLRASNFIKSNNDLDKLLADIIKYSDNDEQITYLFGRLYKVNNFSSHLPKNENDAIIQYIKNENLLDIFYGKTKPEFEKLKYLGIILLFVAFALILTGIIQLLNSTAIFGISSRYLALVVREGGTKIIFGVLLFIGGSMRYRYEKRKLKFLAYLTSK